MTTDKYDDSENLLADYYKDNWNKQDADNREKLPNSQQAEPAQAGSGSEIHGKGSQEDKLSDSG